MTLLHLRSMTALRPFSSLLCSLLLYAVSQGQQIKITDEPYAVTQIQGLQSIDFWVAPIGANVYCVSDSSVSNLRFSCPDCNQTNPAENDFIQELQRKSKDETSRIAFQGFVLKLEQPTISADLFGKTLRCEGTKQGVQSRSAFEAPSQQSSGLVGYPGYYQSQQMQQQQQAQPQYYQSRPGGAVQGGASPVSSSSFSNNPPSGTNNNNNQQAYYNGQPQLPQNNQFQQQRQPYYQQGQQQTNGQSSVNANYRGQSLQNGDYQFQQRNGGSQAGSNYGTYQQQQQAAPGQGERSSSAGFLPDLTKMMDAFDSATTARTDARINVKFIKHPRIVNQKQAGPVVTNEGNKYFLKSGDTLGLQCIADANPPAVTFKWTSDGQVFSTSQQATVDYMNFLTKTVVCSANNGLAEADGLFSPQVRIDPFDTPRILTSATDQRPIGIDPNGKVRLGSNVQLLCSASGQPEPTIFWWHMVGGLQRNASCTEGSNTIIGRQQIPLNVPGGGPSQGQAGAGYYYTPNRPLPAYERVQMKMAVQSKCTVPIHSYIKAGSYWCSACNMIADGHWECEPKGPAPGQQIIIDVQGQPVTLVDFERPDPLNPGRSLPPQQAIFVDVDQSQGTTSGDRGVRIRVTYCADPMPQPQQSEVYWDVGNKRINVNQQVGHYQALMPKQNMTFQDCYDADLIISPVETSDIEPQFYLNVKNQYGTLRQKIELPDGIAGLHRSSGLGLALGLGIGVGGGLIVIIIILSACWYFGLCCFAGMKGKRSQSGGFRSKEPPGLKGMKPQPIKPELVTRPSPPRGGGYHNGTNGNSHHGTAKIPLSADDSFHDSVTGSEKSEPTQTTTSTLPVHQQRTNHEGLTYAELDLVKESRQGAAAPPRPPRRPHHSPVAYDQIKPPSYQDYKTGKTSNSSIV